MADQIQTSTFGIKRPPFFRLDFHSLNAEKVGLISKAASKCLKIKE
jgi:hypothetical protein